MRKFATSLVAATVVVAVTTLGAPAHAAPPIQFKTGNAWCC